MNAINYKELNKFFATIGKSLDGAEVDKQYLWMALYICDYMASVQELNKESSILNEQFFINSLHIDNLSELERISIVPEAIKNYAVKLREKMLENNIIGSLLFVIQNELKKDHVNEVRKIKMSKFNKAHFSKTIKLTMLGAALTAAYYTTGSLWVTAGVGVGLFVFNRFARKIQLSRKKKKEELQNQREIENSTWKRHHGYKYIEKLKDIAKWGDTSHLSEECSVQLEDIKTNLVMFASIYPQRKRFENIYMENDIIKINEVDIPKILDGIKSKAYDQNSVKEILEKMNKKIKNHLSVLFEEGERELSITNNYWTTKLASDGKLEDLENMLEKNA